MTARKATIGVLGGMGPEATILFMQKIIDAVQADDDADHIPLIVYNNTQVPSRIKALIEGGGKDPAPALAAMARSLEQAGAKALAMPCNTAHSYAGAITDAASIPFLNMVHLAASRALDLAGPGARVGLLGSPALRTTRVLDTPLADAGLTPVYGDDADDRLAIIQSVKKRGVSQDAIDALRKATQRLVDLRANVIMVCCTEFSLMADQLRAPAPLFDTLDVLVDTCVAFSTGQSASQSFSDEAVRGSSAACVPPKTDQQGKENLQC